MKKGFTLIEAILFITILGILYLVAVPQMTRIFNDLKLNLAASQVAADIRYARELAVSHKCIGTSCLTDKKCGVEFFTATNSYQVFCLNGAAKTVVSDPMTRSNMVVNFSARPEFSGITLSSVSLCVGTCATKELRIDSFGNPYDANNVLYTAPATVTLALGGDTKMIRVTQQTGYTEIV